MKVIGCRALLLVLGTAAGCTQAQEQPSPEAQAMILDLVQRQALYRDRVDWPRVREQLAAERDPVQARRLLDDVLARSSGGHGRWISARLLREQAEPATAAQNAMITGTPAVASEAGGAGADRRVGWIAVGSYLDDRTQLPAQQNELRKQAASALQTRIREQDDGDRCGWIVDLRGNGGGNMWPMLLGIGPLLGDAKGADPVGMFISGGQHLRWAYRDGAVWSGPKPVVGSRQTRYTLRRPGAPVAVLFGPRTASSGEAMVLAFRGRADTRSFGQPSAGYSTGNIPQRLPDGSMLLLTTNVMADRNGNGDGGKIAPDVVVADAPAAAHAWLLQQPACHDALNAPR